MQLEADINPCSDDLFNQFCKAGVLAPIDPWKVCTVDDLIDEAIEIAIAMEVAE